MVIKPKSAQPMTDLSTLVYILLDKRNMAAYFQKYYISISLTDVQTVD